MSNRGVGTTTSLRPKMPHRCHHLPGCKPYTSNTLPRHRALRAYFALKDRLSRNFLAPLAGEVTFQEKEPFSIVFLIQAWLNACSRLLGSLYEGGKFRGFGQTLEDVRRWGAHSGNKDAMYFTMAALALFLPQREEKSESLAIDQVLGEIFSGIQEFAIPKQ